VLLNQHSRLGDYAPPHVLLEIEDIQTAIRSLKAELQTADVVVNDEPNDDAKPITAAAPSRLSPQAQRNRSRMLDKVEAFWVKGVLDQSLYQIARLELDFEQAPAQVSHPWETVLQQVNQPNETIPAGKSIVSVFADLLGELLILGAPGAGKTKFYPRGLWRHGGIVGVGGHGRLRLGSRYSHVGMSPGLENFPARVLVPRCNRQRRGCGRTRLTV
jgi:hypothetical protein